jgi:hypothetical protein
MCADHNRNRKNGKGSTTTTTTKRSNRSDPTEEIAVFLQTTKDDHLGELFQELEAKAKKEPQAVLFELAILFDVAHIFPICSQEEVTKTCMRQGEAMLLLSLVEEDIMGLSANMAFYNETVVRNTNRLLTLFMSTIVRYPLLEKILLSRRLRILMYERWYRFSMVARYDFVNTSSRPHVPIPLLDRYIPEPHCHQRRSETQQDDPRECSSNDDDDDDGCQCCCQHHRHYCEELPTPKWYKRFVYSAVLGDYAFRLSYGSLMGGYFWNSAISDDKLDEFNSSLKDFYRIYFKKYTKESSAVAAAFLDPITVEYPSASSRRRKRRPEDGDKGEEEQTPRDAPKSRITKSPARMKLDDYSLYQMLEPYGLEPDTEFLALYTYLQSTYGVLPGVLEMLCDEKFELISDPEKPVFPGSAWLERMFTLRIRSSRKPHHSSIPWYKREKSTPHLAYYVLIREALLGTEGADVIRIPFITMKVPKEIIPRLMPGRSLVKIIGDDHILFPDKYHIESIGDDDDEDDADGFDGEGITYMVAPMPVVPPIIYMAFDIRWLRFIDNALCIEWINANIKYSHWVTRRMDVAKAVGIEVPTSILNFTMIYRTCKTNDHTSIPVKDKTLNRKTPAIVLRYQEIESTHDKKYFKFKKPIYARERIKEDENRIIETLYYGAGGDDDDDDDNNSAEEGGGIALWSLVRQFYFVPQ